MSPRLIDFRSIVIPARPSPYGRHHAALGLYSPQYCRPMGSARRKKHRFMRLFILAPLVLLAVLTAFSI